MEKDERLNGYLGLLKIRRKAYFRNMIAIGIVFLFALLSTSAMVLLTEWNPRSIWIMGMFDVLFILSFIMAWARLEITNEKIELMNNLLQA